MIPLTHDLIRQIATEEALAARCTYDELLHMGRRPEAAAARTRAWARIIAETGCRGTELARAWGCDPNVILRAFPKRRRAPQPKPRPTYDRRTIEHFRWAHGDERAVEIIAGRDLQTEADIAAWRALGTA